MYASGNGRNTAVRGLAVDQTAMAYVNLVDLSMPNRSTFTRSPAAVLLGEQVWNSFRSLAD